MPGNPVSLIKKNRIRSAVDPNATVTSMASVNSVNLERINQRNADRLVRLEND